MKKLLWMMLATLPTQAMANNEDPIAYKCYYCTPAEMEDVALAQGVGRHYVYDYSNLGIVGFEVERAGSNLIAKRFVAESWVEQQFKGMAALYNITSGTMHAGFAGVTLLAPGTEHGRSMRFLWGHHLSALHPDHLAARETVHRFLSNAPTLSFLNTSDSDGKLLRFAHTLETGDSIIARMNFGPYPNSSGHGLIARFYFDHASRKWVYLDAEDKDHPIQQSRIDFAPAEGITRFRYDDTPSPYAVTVFDRARWASVPVHGKLPTYGNVRFRCERNADDIQCYVEQ